LEEFKKKNNFIFFFSDVFLEWKPAGYTIFFFSLAAAATTKTTQKIETGNQNKKKIKLVEKCTQKRNNKF
jgi:hypothetical protein